MARGVAIVAALLMAGCIEGTNEGALVPDGGDTSCTPGRTVSCACGGGRSGVQTCQADGTFEACGCAAGPTPDAELPPSDAALRADGGPPSDAAVNVPDGEPVPPACDEGAQESAPCGEGGMRTRTCASATWGDFGPCRGECDDGSRQRRPCGLNGRGEESRPCVATTWDAWSACDDPDACVDAEIETRACGLNGRGQEARACAAGQWGGFEGCADPDACVDGAVRPRLCGRNERGVARDACADGAWTEAACEDPDVCDDDDAEQRVCGATVEGGQARGCQAGQWSAWGPCDDPTRACEDRSIEEVPCGLNRRGRQSHTCEGEAWGSWTACVDPDACVDTARDIRPCDRRGLQSRACVEGAWGEWDGCADAADCADGDVEGRACGLNGRGAQSRSCVDGAWSVYGPCEDTDVCADGSDESEECGDAGERLRRCVGGRWSDWSECEGPARCPNGTEPPCEVGDNVCPAPAVVVAEIEALPLEIVTLDGSASVDDDGAGGHPVEYRWVVIARPAGSVAVPVERFFDAAHPADGGVADDQGTPTAQFFIDLAGLYVFELVVADAGGLEAPGERCPARPARVTVRAVPQQDVLVQLTWDTPGDPDQADSEGTDLDVHLRHPQGAGWSVAPFDCYFANVTPDWGPAGAAGNPSLDIDDTNGAGPENISLMRPEETAALGGPYRVGVLYYRSTNFVAGTSFGPSTAMVRIFFGGLVAAEYQQALVADNQFWQVANIHWEAGAGRVEEVGVVTDGVP